MANSVLIHKATRGSKLLKAGLAEKDAIQLASSHCDSARGFQNAGLLPSGVALLVVNDEYAAQVADKGIYMMDRSKVLFQAGNF